jgi:hypothetical protein
MPRLKLTDSVADWNVDGKCRTNCGSALHGDIPTQESGKVTADCESQTRSSMLAGCAAVDLMKFLENSFQGLGGNADPVSATTITMSAPRLFAVTLTEPFSVNLTALLRRLVRI